VTRQTPGLRHRLNESGFGQAFPALLLLQVTGFVPVFCVAMTYWFAAAPALE
jgi:hypothetical protein